MFLSTNYKVTGIWNSEVGSRKSMEKAEDIQFHPWNTTYIFTAVKIQLFIFSRLWNTAFLKYAFYLSNIFLYFITLYIIKRCTEFLVLLLITSMSSKGFGRTTHLNSLLSLPYIKSFQDYSWIQDFEDDFPQKVHRKSSSKSWIKEIILASMICFPYL